MRNLILHFIVLPVAIVIAIVAGFLFHDMTIGVVIGMATSIVILVIINRLLKAHA